MRVCLLALCVAAWPHRATAQTSHSVEIFGGYSSAHDPMNNISLPAGWLSGGAVGVTDWLAAVVDISGGYKAVDAFDADIRLSAHGVMAGGRVSARLGPLTEVGQMVGRGVRGRGTALRVTHSAHAVQLQPG